MDVLDEEEKNEKENIPDINLRVHSRYSLYTAVIVSNPIGSVSDMRFHEYDNALDYLQSSLGENYFKNAWTLLEEGLL